MYRMIAVLLAVCGFVTSAHADFIAFTDTTPGQFFLVPSDVTSVNVLAIGGGGGGANGHQGGGGAGFLSVATVTVSPGDLIPIVVGMGGTGAMDCDGCNDIVGLAPGTGSSFGSLVFAPGGGVVSGINQGGQDGSSGGGGACNSGSLGGPGGSAGGDGSPCQIGSSMPIGFGQGDYTGLLSLFVDNFLTSGLGGIGGTGTHAGAGGGGGILINGLGPLAESGSQAWSGQGGAGYGAGGGSGGLDFAISGIRYAGGDGADGLVYIEFVTAETIPEPASLALMGLGLTFVGLLRGQRANPQTPKMHC